MDHIDATHVQYRSPALIRCAGCDDTVEGQDANEVVKTAGRYGWRVFRGHPYCEQCQKSRLQAIAHLDRIDRWYGTHHDG